MKNILTPFAFSASMAALNYKRLAPRSGVFLMPERPTEADRKIICRVDRRKYNTLRGNTVSVLVDVVEARHLRGVSTNKTKLQEMKSIHPMGDLETEIYSTEAMLELLTNELVRHCSEQSEALGRLAAGFINLTHQRQQALHQAYDAVFNQWRELGGHKK